MPATDRLLSERDYHDRQARQRLGQRVSDNHLRFDDDVYLDHETWIRPAIAEFDVLRGRRLLDFGCGHGMAAVVFARAGARVTAMDLSSGYLEETAARAEANGVSLSLVQADGERLPFANGSFDRIWGNAVLHHLDMDRAGGELHRVLAPGGKAAFCEPWGGNVLLRGARRWLPYPGKARTPDEQPLRQADVDKLARIFPLVRCRGFQLLSMARRVLRANRLLAGLDWCDRQLLERVPRLENYCRYVVLTLQRDP